ncbi:probable glycosyl transferase, group 1 [Crocosphaera subtropica ATCC 51142]|uniref:Probable glycosyl transferase, group 1 n=1 Tax=Crocosphaera subtropica (strain ATCC 51142 / BH68) TaxID=43989 RepID=B1WP84_CROS5|nr:glycosyltransferase [Crocosphaera subtropica]ACB49866.1 probable glycosyl transferase, group 1 [Crocosphaera subtropica ATCC 51142]
MKYLNLGCGSHFHPDWTNVDFVSTQEGIIAHDLRQGIPFEDASFDVVYHSHVLEHFSQREGKRFLEECHRVLRPYGLIRVVVPDLEQIAKLYLKALEKASQGSLEWAANYHWILLEMFDQVARHQSGGEMAAYLADETIPNESFVIKRIGAEGENLIKLLRPLKSQLQPPLSFNPETDDLEETALKIGKFRLGGEVHQWMYDRYSLQRLLTKTGFSDFKVCQANESNIPDFKQFGLDVQPDGRVRKPDSLFVEAIKSRPNQWQQAYIPTMENTQTLKILQLNTVDIAGGAARAAYRLHKGLQQAKQHSLMLVNKKYSTDETVCLVQSLPDAETSQQIGATTLQTFYINENRTNISNTLFSFPYPGWDVSQVEEVQEADIIQLHWVAMFQSPQTVKQLSSLGKPMVWTLHDMWAFTGGCHYAAGCEGYQSSCENCPQLKEDTFGLAQAILQDKLDILSGLNLTIVTPSHWLADCVRKSALFKHQRIEVIPNGIETDIFIPIPKAKAKESLGIKPNTFTLLIGADNGNEKRKGFEEMLKALSVCLEDEKFSQAVQQEQVKLLCFGLPNDELNSLDIPVVSLGQINSDEKLAEVYSSADIFVLPSLEDNLPNTMLESMSCGTPVIGFEVGGLPDVVKENVTGNLVPLENSSALAQVILSYFRSPQKVEDIGKNCRQLLEENYSLSVQAQAYLKLYQDLLAHQTPLSYADSKQRLSSEASLSSLDTTLEGIYVPIETEFNSISGSIFESVLRYALSQKLAEAQDQVKNLLVEKHNHIQLIGELREEVKELTVQLQLSQIEKESLQQIIDQRDLTIEDIKEQLHRSENNRLDLLQKIDQLQENLNISQATIEGMESSKFWQLRMRLVALKQFLKLKRTD